MEDLLNSFYRSRVGQYVIYGILFLSFRYLFGFEFAVLVCMTTILGEIHYQNLNRE